MTGVQPKIYTVKGFSGTLSELSDKYHISMRTLQSRLRRGIPLETALNTPVSKIYSVQTPTMLQVGKYKGSADEVRKRFGINLNMYARTNSEKAVKVIKTYHAPKFYEIGDYKGTLTAIAQDFGCPISTLQFGLKNNETPAQVIEKGDYQLIN